MKTKTKAHIQRVFTIAIGIFAMLPIIDSYEAKWYYPFPLFGLLSLGSYVSTVLFKKRKLALYCFCSCALYFLIYDMRNVPFPPNPAYLGMAFAILLGSVLRFVIEIILLIQGYFGLVTLEKEQNIAKDA